MKEDSKKIVERYFGDVLKMEEDVSRLEEIVRDKKNLSPKISEMYEHIQATQESVKSIKGSMEDVKNT